MYVYGGYNTDKGLVGVLSSLNIDTLTWSDLCPETVGGPMKKDGCGMVHFHCKKLAVIGGYAGIPHWAYSGWIIIHQEY